MAEFYLSIYSTTRRQPGQSTVNQKCVFYLFSIILEDDYKNVWLEILCLGIFLAPKFWRIVWIVLDGLSRSPLAGLSKGYKFLD